MSSDPRFMKRMKRLIVVSAVALGLICLLVYTTSDAGWGAIGLMIAGWVSMPTLLAGGLARPKWRYLLVVPAGLVSTSLVIVAVGFDGSAVAKLGWWLMTAGVLVGGTLGGWFWYRWMPVPPMLEEPFSSGRWTLIAIHAGLVVTGGVFVLYGEVL